jgi:hypothetical protein
LAPTPCLLQTVCREGFLDAVTGDGGAHWQVPSCVNNLVLILIKFIKKKYMISFTISNYSLFLALL